LSPPNLWNRSVRSQKGTFWVRLRVPPDVPLEQLMCLPVERDSLVGYVFRDAAGRKTALNRPFAETVGLGML